VFVRQIITSRNKSVHRRATLVGERTAGPLKTASQSATGRNSNPGDEQRGSSPRNGSSPGSNGQKFESRRRAERFQSTERVESRQQRAEIRIQVQGRTFPDQVTGRVVAAGRRQHGPVHSAWPPEHHTPQSEYLLSP